MTDYEYIIKQVKLFHYKGWEEGELRKCVDMLPHLSRQELTSLYYSKWVKEDKVFREAVPIRITMSRGNRADFLRKACEGLEV